ARGRHRIFRQDRHKRPRGPKVMSEEVGQPRDTKPGGRGGGEGDAIVGLEAPLRLDSDDCAAVEKVPRLVTLHQRLVFEDFRRGLRRAIEPEIVWTGDQLAVDGAYPPGDEVRILERSDADGTVEALRDQVDE